MTDIINRKIFVINMYASRESWLNISFKLDALNLPYEYIDGIDASRLSSDGISKHYSYLKNKKLFSRPLLVGEIGCHISHINCWLEIVRQNLDFGIVLEDDAILSGKFPSAIRFLQEHPFEWDFIRLQPETKNRILYSQKKFLEFSFNEYVRTSGASLAYAVNINTARKLSCELLPFGCTADSNSHLYYKYGINILTIIPPVVFPWNTATERALDSKTKIKNHYPFSRQIFQLKSYTGKLLQLLRRDGIKTFSRRLINVKICKAEEWKS